MLILVAGGCHRRKSERENIEREIKEKKRRKEEITKQIKKQRREERTGTGSEGLET